MCSIASVPSALRYFCSNPRVKSAWKFLFRCSAVTPSGRDAFAIASSSASAGRYGYFFCRNGPQPIGHDDVAQVALDLAAVLITITGQREQPINRGRFELRFRALIRHC